MYLIACVFRVNQQLAVSNEHILVQWWLLWSSYYIHGHSSRVWRSIYCFDVLLRYFGICFVFKSTWNFITKPSRFSVPCQIFLSDHWTMGCKYCFMLTLPFSEFSLCKTRVWQQTVLSAWLKGKLKSSHVSEKELWVRGAQRSRKHRFPRVTVAGHVVRRISRCDIAKVQL